MKVLIITGSRGEWGYIRPILRLMDKDEGFDYDLCVTNMHLLPANGLSVREIEKDGFLVRYKLPMSYEGGTHITQIKSLGSFLMSLGDVLASESYDMILLSGDRGEQLMGAIAGAYCYIPTAHIQAGEISGNIDGAARHAIGKLVHLHFAANEDAYERLVKLGEEENRVHLTGAPQIDEMVSEETLSYVETCQHFAVDPDKGFILVVQHPVTEDYEIVERDTQILFNALSDVDIQKICISPNNDAGADLVKNAISNSRSLDMSIFDNLPRGKYLSLLRHTKVLVGNSSSGLLEAPTYSTPAINLGRRQHGRYRGINVIDCEYNKLDILEAIKEALKPEFKRLLLEKKDFPYGKGNSSKKILDVFRSVRLDQDFLVKRLTY